ncbi:hypothetical protein CJ195_09545 [Bacillus sp. UMB0899]|nr:hypothetical protein CJ195_09545 [Bacillus sp. UMB0899]
MELQLSKSINKYYWILFSLIFVLNSQHNIFTSLELQFYRFIELEDFGLLLFALGLSALESALITVFLLWIMKLLNRILIKLNSTTKLK